MGPCWPRKTRKQPHPQWQAEHCRMDLVIVAGILCPFRVTGQTLPDAEIWVICRITETDVRLQCHSQRKWLLTPLRRCSRIKLFLTMKNLRKRSQKRQHLLLSNEKSAGNGKRYPPHLWKLPLPFTVMARVNLNKHYSCFLGFSFKKYLRQIILIFGTYE